MRNSLVFVVFLVVAVGIASAFAASSTAAAASAAAYKPRVVRKNGAADSVTRFASQNVLVWMGLERTRENITSDLHEIQANVQSLTKVSFEDYDLGPNSTLVNNGFTPVNGDIRSYGLGAYPMITTVNIEYIRQLCNNSEPFITAAVQEAVKYGYTGYNIDFEPNGAEATDAKPYTAFLTKFADALHAVNKTLSVDIASWSPFWDFDAIAATSIDTMITMDTYAGNITTFEQSLKKAVLAVQQNASNGLNKLGIGLMTTNPNTREPYSDDDLKNRFTLLDEYGIEEIDIWVMPVPENWWPFIDQFLGN